MLRDHLHRNGNWTHCFLYGRHKGQTISFSPSGVTTLPQDSQLASVKFNNNVRRHVQKTASCLSERVIIKYQIIIRGVNKIPNSHILLELG